MANIIFDFDGTVADSFEVVVKIIHDLTNRREQIPPDEIERLRGMSLRQGIREIKVHPWRIPFLVTAGRRLMRGHMNELVAFPGMPSTIRKLAKEHNVYMMSSNSVQNIELFLHKHELSHVFLKLYGGVSLLGKAHVLRRVMEQNKLSPGETFYIGDEVRDVVGSKRAGIKMVAVSWGYNNAAILAEHGPDALVDTPAELLEVIPRLLGKR